MLALDELGAATSGWLLPAVGAAIAVLAGLAIAVFESRRRRHRRNATSAQAARREPWDRGEVLSLVSLIAGTALAIVGLVNQSGGGGTPPVDVGYLANLIRQSQFTEALPNPLRAGAIGDVEIGDPSAAARVDAVKLSIDGPPGLYGVGVIEVYPSMAQAARRGHAARVDSIQRYGAQNVFGSDASFCVSVTQATTGAWSCSAYRSYAYVEASVSSNSNADRGLATGTTAALLRYTERETQIARGRR